MKHYTYFDIETGPVPEAEMQALIPEFNPDDVKLGNLKDQKKIEAKIEAARENHVTNFTSKAALSPLTGQVLAIGWARDSEAPITHFKSDFFDDEAGLLRAFWQEFNALNSNRIVRWVGFNILRFDVPFLIKRSMKHGIGCPGAFDGDRFSHQWLDLFKVWQMGDYKLMQSLDKICRFMGMEGKNGNGGDFDFYFRTEPDKADGYLINDVEITRNLHRKFQQTFGE